MLTGFFRKKALITSAFFVLLLQSSFAVYAQTCTSSHTDAHARVKQVYDGDTLRLHDGRKLRFIGINTPELGRNGEPDEPLAQAAKSRLKQFIPAGARVALVYGKQRKDRHGRTLAHVFTMDGLNVSAQLIREGLAFAIVVPPNDGFVECYFDAEKDASKQGNGIWAVAYYQSVEVKALPDSTRGFKRVQGKITGIGQSKRNIWLDMGKNFSLKLSRKNLHYFADNPVEQMINRTISVRGWVGHYNGKLRMSFNHPAMMESLQ